MTTWTCKAGAAVIGLATLTACDAVNDVPLLGKLAPPNDAPAEGETAVALSQTQMANGAFTLVPPQGFCVDKSSLNQRFALLARCDTLGVPNGGGGAPVGILTVSVVPKGISAALPTPQETADALKLARVDAVTSEVDAITFQAEGAPPIADMDITHWRGTIRIGTQVVSLALFGPKGGRAVTPEGREILNSLIRRSRAASTS